MIDINSTKSSDTQAGVATELVIGGSGLTDTPIGTECNIGTNATVFDADRRIVSEGTVEWTMSTNPAMPGMTLALSNHRICRVKGIVSQTFDLTLRATYPGLSDSKTITVKAIPGKAI